jgi:hypothetical protein
MVRRLLVLLAVLACAVAAAVPAAASAGTVSQTFHFSSNPPFAAPLPCSSLAGWNEIDEDSGNGVIHMTGNANGFWITGTYEGDIQIRPVVPDTFDAMGNPLTWHADTSGRPSAQGHVADWFGASFNLKNAVQHDAVNAQVTDSNGQSISFHMIDHIQLAPPTTPGGPPVVTHQFQNARCF